MSINLSKGQEVKFSDAKVDTSKTIKIGLGWEPEKPGMFSSTSANWDLDASAVLLKNGKYVSENDLVYFGSKTHRSGSVKHGGDNLTGHGKGDDEVIEIRLSQIPTDYNSVVFIVNVFDAQSRNQHFGKVKDAFIRAVDGNGNEIARYKLDEKDYNGVTAIEFGKLTKINGEFVFQATGKVHKENRIQTIAESYK